MCACVHMCVHAGQHLHGEGRGELGAVSCIFPSWLQVPFPGWAQNQVLLCEDNFGLVPQSGLQWPKPKAQGGLEDCTASGEEMTCLLPYLGLRRRLMTCRSRYPTPGPSAADPPGKAPFPGCLRSGSESHSPFLSHALVFVEWLFRPRDVLHHFYFGIACLETAGEC